MVLLHHACTVVTVVFFSALHRSRSSFLKPKTAVHHVPVDLVLQLYTQGRVCTPKTAHTYALVQYCCSGRAACSVTAVIRALGISIRSPQKYVMIYCCDTLLL